MNAERNMKSLLWNYIIWRDLFCSDLIERRLLRLLPIGMLWWLTDKIENLMRQSMMLEGQQNIRNCQNKNSIINDAGNNNGIKHKTKTLRNVPSVIAS